MLQNSVDNGNNQKIRLTRVYTGREIIPHNPTLSSCGDDEQETARVWSGGLLDRKAGISSSAGSECLDGGRRCQMEKV